MPTAAGSTARLALARAARPELKDFARRVIVKQTLEIELLGRLAEARS